jgi:hypothetical protein
MRIRRVNSIEDFVRELTLDNECLPVLVIEGHELNFAAATNAPFSRLNERNEIEWLDSLIGLPALALHGILAFESSDTVDLARRYATLTARPFALITSTLQLSEGVSISHWTSVTVVPPINLGDAYAKLETIYQLIRDRSGVGKPLGMLVSDDLEGLSWLIMKQLNRFGPAAPDDAVVAPGEGDRCVLRSSGRLPLLADGTNRSRLELKRIATTAPGVLFLQGHARMHCGILHTLDGPLGVCGSPTQGREGRCFGDTACVFEHDPKLLLQELAAECFFYNSCFTAKISDSPFGVPVEANLGLAALRGGVAQMVGNYRMGQYSERDIHWFIVLSGLGYSPAAAVGIIQTIREDQRRQTGISLLFIGDAATRPWQSFPLPQVEITINNDTVTLTWQSTSIFVGCAIPGTNLARLAATAMLDVLVMSSNVDFTCQTAIARDTRNDLTLLLMLLPEDHADGRTISLELKPRSEPINRAVGDTLASAVVGINFMGRCNLFRDQLAEPRDSMTNQLIALRRFLANSDDLLELKNKLTAVHDIERRTAASADALMVEIASTAAAAGRWNWEEEYADLVHFDSLQTPQECPLCGCRAYQYRSHSFSTEVLKRQQTVCVECGLISDLPLWQIEVRLSRRAPVRTENLFSDSLELRNNGPDDLTCVAALRINSFKDVRDESDHGISIELPSGQTVTVEMPLVIEAPLSGFYRVRVHLASFGQFGFVARPFIF